MPDGTRRCGGMTRRARAGAGRVLRRLGLLLVLAAVLPAGPACAHSVRAPAGGAKGVPIANLTHGQMRVLARHRGEILALAARQSVTDLTFRRLVNHEAIQFATCLWGVMPGSVTDEASPFNECAHAYLATDREILTHMATMAADPAPVRALVDRISLELADDRESLVLCQYSGEGFDTANVVHPDWTALPGHWPSLAAAALFAALGAGGVEVLRRATSARPDAHA